MILSKNNSCEGKHINFEMCNKMWSTLLSESQVLGSLGSGDHILCHISKLCAPLHVATCKGAHNVEGVWDNLAGYNQMLKSLLTVVIIFCPFM